MKKILSLIVCLILVISSITFAYAEVSSREFDNIDSSSTQIAKKSMVLSLDKVNLYSPIKFTNEYDDFYSYEIFDLLFNYGDVNIIINEVDEENLFKESLLTKKYRSSLIELKPNTKYVYDISVMQDEFYFMTFYGEITTGENSGDPVYCELLKLRDNINARSDKELLATMSEAEPNNTFATANTIYDNYDVNATISTVYDVDMFKVKFTNSGKANFWLGNISNISNLDLYVYNESQQLIASSKGSGSTQELISYIPVVGGKWYYIKVIAANENVNAPSSYQVNAKFHEIAIWPAVNKVITACYECEKYYILYGTRHRGTDIAPVKHNTDGDDIYAILPGVVTKIIKNHSELGNYIVIRHSGDYPLYNNNTVFISSRYAHLSKISDNLKVGDSIKKSDIIGKMGKTGNPGGQNNMETHLHLEIIQHNDPNYNPDLNNRISIDPGKNFYPEFKCTFCNEYPVSLRNSDLAVYNDLKNVGISLNNNYFIDAGAFEYLTIEEVQNYGINSEDLKMLIEIIKDDTEFSKYIEHIYNLIDILEN